MYAQYAGLGWIGKNTCASRGRSSWISVRDYLQSSLQPDPPAVDQCGTCTLCLEACPTGAFVEPHCLDATKCISYLTIEYRGSIPEGGRSGIDNHIFGCDICQEVCPWNGAPATTADPTWSERRQLSDWRVLDLWRRNDEELAQMIEGTPLARAGCRGLRRNLAVALGNSGRRQRPSACPCEGGRPARCRARGVAVENLANQLASLLRPRSGEQSIESLSVLGVNRRPPLGSGHRILPCHFAIMMPEMHDHAQQQMAKLVRYPNPRMTPAVPVNGAEVLARRRNAYASPADHP